MLSLILLFTIFSIFIISFYISNKKKWEKLSKIKSEPSLPIIGHALKLGWTKEEFLPSLERMWNNCGRDNFILKLGPITQVVITKPYDVETILSSNTEIEKNVLYENYKDLAGDSIITHESKKWREIRRIISPAFSYKFLEGYLEIFRDEVDILMNDITSKPNQDIDIHPIFNARALQAVCRIGMGFNINVNEAFQEYLKVLEKAMDLVNARVFSTWKSVSFLYKLSREGQQFNKTIKYLNDYKDKIINKKREDLEYLINEVNEGKTSIEYIVKNEKVITIMEILLLSKKTNGEAFSNVDIRSEIITLTFAGHETVASAAAFTSYLLAIHPEIQDEVFKEQQLISGGDLSKRITFQDLQDMKLLDCVIKESMRLYGPAVFFGRKLSNNVMLSDGIELPAGTNLLFLPYLSHKNPAVFSDPNKFDPYRFMENHPSQYLYFPFSAGPRNCIGYKWGLLEIKFWLSTILRRLELLPPMGEHPQVIVEVVLKSNTGINLRWRERR